MRTFTAAFSLFILAAIAVVTVIVVANVDAGHAEEIVVCLGIAALPFAVLLFRLMWSSTSSFHAAENNKYSAGNEEAAIRELINIQSKIEQRVTNLETILLSRVPGGGIHTDKF